MKRIAQLYTYLSLALLIILSLLVSQNISAITAYPTGEPKKKTKFNIQILKSNSQPQTDMILKINGRNNKYTNDSTGLFTFDYEIEKNYFRTADIYFSNNEKHSVKKFTLGEAFTDTIFFIDSPEDLAIFKQTGNSFPIKGIVKTPDNLPLSGATISIQGTGKKTYTNETGEFTLEADYAHPIIVRAKGMENHSLTIQQFLSHPDTPYIITMRRKGADRIYNSVDCMPEYQGGMKAFRKYLKKELKYPEKALQTGIEGVVIIRFIVEKDGSISHPEIVRRLEPEMDTIALNVIQRMPKWIPGTEQGITVRCKYSLPIQFKRPVSQVSSYNITNQISVKNDSILEDSLSVIPARNILPFIIPSKELILPDDSLTLRLLVPESLQTDRLKSVLFQQSIDKAVLKKENFFKRLFRRWFGKTNRVGGTGLIPVPTSHTTVRAVRHTAVP